MADLSTNFIGIKSPNPYWLASAPPTDKAYNVVRAFQAGWGGVVWKTLGEDPPVVNVSSRYGAINYKGNRVAGFNNIELISDRPLEVNLREIKEVKRDWPDRAMIVSLMVPCTEDSWKNILARVEDTEADGIELNFGCPHGMSERGMGAAVGQVPEYVEMVARWCKQYSRMPVIVKLTPNITNILTSARAAVRGGADAVSLINTINSITAVNLDLMAPEPTVDGKGTHGGYCGPAVKPIALHMVAEIARDPECKNIPISAIGGIETWRDAAEFMALGPVPPRSAPRRCITGSRSSTTWPTACRTGWTGRATAPSRTSVAWRCPTSPTGSTSTSTTRSSPRSTRTCASNAGCATSPARIPRTRRSAPCVSTVRGITR
jgi:dihydropyrimidine dehydrogenase (NAD+) subunit PreA